DGISPQNLVDAVSTFNRPLLGRLDSDYLILGVDESANEIVAASSLSGKFPVYFGIIDGKLVLSTDFGKIARLLPLVKVNTSSLLDYLYTGYFLYITRETPVEGVYKLPPGHRLRVNSELKFKIEPIITAGEFLSEPVEYFKSREKFQEAVLQELKRTVRKMSTAVEDAKLTADLSCGFDSTLLAYVLKSERIDDRCHFFSYISRKDTGDTRRELVEEFAKRHGLNLNIWDETEVVTFSEIDVEWTKSHFFPGTHAALKELLVQKYKREVMGARYVTFHGYGGDELYMAFMIHHDIERIIRDELNWVEEGVKAGIGKIFTRDALDMLRERKRFEVGGLYFSPLATTALEWFLFPVYWEFEDWGLLPYNSLRLNQIARGIPKKDGIPLRKQQIWQGRTDIFVPGQFRQKLPYDDHVMQIFDKRIDFLATVLENSVLERLGLVNAKKMKEEILQGKGGEYFKNLLPVFINLIRAEIFLQNLSKKIS
ncbi:hypothetical protein HYS82_00700, partial [Candidatus Amesbacteria bacterium]|nr:hypothetical protein [Candidatus Amesbacteria bacterium]